jgi:DDE family transposase
LRSLEIIHRRGTFEVKRIKGTARARVTADGHGVVSHAGVGLLREMAENTGLVEGVTAALLDTYKGVPVHPPGRVFADLAVAVADGADAISGISVLVDRPDLFGPVASMPTTWRVLDRIDADHLAGVRAARGAARARAWAAGAAPDLAAELCIDFDATITIAHSEKENAAKTWKKTFGFHPLLAFLDRPDVAGGEALAGLLRKGNAGSNTAVDHVTVLERALDSLPEVARPRPDVEPVEPGRPRWLARSDSAGATHLFAKACRERGLGFSFGYGLDARITVIVDDLEERWVPAVEADGDPRAGAWVAEVTDLIDLSAWPSGTRLVLRKERPHPGAQLRITDTEGHRVTGFITDTADGRGIAALELRHRQHARVEDRIRQAKATGLRNFPCKAWNENQAWLETVLAATDLVCWTRLIGFVDTPELARCEIDAFRYRVLHVAARLTHSARQLHLRIDATWRWAVQIAEGFTRIRAAFA